MAVAVSAFTTLLTPWMIRWSGPAADRVDRMLPDAVRTFSALYDSWLEKMRRAGETAEGTRRRRRGFILLLVDFALMLGILASISMGRNEISSRIASFTGLSFPVARYLLLGLAVLVSAVFCYAIFRETRRLVLAMVGRALPDAEPGKVDLAAAPRKAMVATLETGIVFLVGLPLLAVFQPFLPGLPSAALFLGILLVLAISFWRGTANLEGHVKAVSEAVVEALAKQSQTGGDSEEEKTLRRIRKLFPGMGHMGTLHVGPACRCAGKTIGEMNVGNRTGATILVVLREGKGVLPTGKDVLKPGDLLVLAGTPEAVEAAREFLAPGPGIAGRKEADARRS